MCSAICFGLIPFIRRAIADSTSWHLRHAAPLAFAVSIPWCPSRRMSGANAVMHPASPATASTSAADHGRGPRGSLPILVMYPADLRSGPPRARLRHPVAATGQARPDDAAAMSRLRLTASLVAFVLGCTVGNSKIGTPCDGASDCGEGLICDDHDGKGTCQEPHDHEDTEDTTEDTDHATEHTTGQ